MLRAASPVGTVREERRTRRISGLIVGIGIILILLSTLSAVGYCLLSPDPIRLGSQVLLGPRCTWAVPLEWGESTKWVAPLPQPHELMQIIEVNKPDTPGSYGVQVMECVVPSVPGEESETTLDGTRSNPDSAIPWKVRVVVGGHVRK